MPDKRKHRGAHPADARLFAHSQVPRLQIAVAEYSWLLSRGYSEVASLKLVGDRHALAARQRVAVARCSCGEEQLASRARRRLMDADLRGSTVAIDGFNVLIILESAFSGGVVLRGRDRCHRDLASVHGSYRAVQETPRAILALGELFERWGVDRCLWYLDRPVSNSGRLKSRLLEVAGQHGWAWQVDLVQNCDLTVAESDAVVATSDSWILDRCECWVDILGSAMLGQVPEVWLVDLGTTA